MKESSKEERLLNTKLQRRIIRFKAFISFVVSIGNKISRKHKHIEGQEIYLDTEDGKVRVLAYNLEVEERLPLFVNLHGGGFCLGSAEMDDPFMMIIARGANVKIINVDYCLAPESPFPKAVNECYAVIKYAKEHPDEFGIDADRIALGGQSAGGNFSAAVCLMDNDRKSLDIECLVLDYPPLDVYTDASQKPHPKGSIPMFMSRMFDACYCYDKEERKNPLVSPVYASADQIRSFPATLVITARRDSLCGEAESFRDKLMEAGVDVTHKRFDAGHGFNLRRGDDADESWQVIIEHLKRYLWT